MEIEWIGYKGHRRTDEELLYALKWCERNGITVSFSKGRTRLRIPGKRYPVRAYDIADGVKACIERYGMAGNV